MEDCRLMCGSDSVDGAARGLLKPAIADKLWVALASYASAMRCPVLTQGGPLPGVH